MIESTNEVISRKLTDAGQSQIYIFDFSILQLPDIFTREINFSNNLYYLTFKFFGYSTLYFEYQFAIMSIIRACAITSIIVMNIFNVIEYKKFIRHKHILVNETKKMHADIEFTSLYVYGLINITWSYIFS